MSLYNSNLPRLTGLSSGIDTDMIVRQMMSAESLRLNKLKQRRTLTEWKQQAYRNVATLMRTFQNTFASVSGANVATSLRMPSNFQTLAAAARQLDGTESFAAKVRALTNAVTGSFELDVKSAAQKDVYVGRNIPLTYSADYNVAMGHVLGGSPAAGDQFTVSLDGGPAVTITLSYDDVRSENPYTLVENINKKLAERFQYTVGPDGKPSNNQKVSVSIQNGVVVFAAGQGHSVSVGMGASDRDVLKKLGFNEAGTTAFDLKMSLGAAAVSGGAAVSSPFYAQNKITFDSLKAGFTFGGDSHSFDEYSFTVRYNGGATKTITLNKADVASSDPLAVIDNINKKLADEFGYNIGSNGRPDLNSPKVSLQYTSELKQRSEEYLDGGETKTRVVSYNEYSLFFAASAGDTVEIGRSGGNPDQDALQILGFAGGGIAGVDPTASAGFDSGRNKIEFTINDVRFTFDRSDSLEKMMNDINKSAAGVTLSFDSFRSAFKLESNHTGVSAAIRFDDPNGFLSIALGIDANGSYKGKSQDLTIAAEGTFQFVENISDDLRFQAGDSFVAAYNGISKKITLEAGDVETGDPATIIENINRRLAEAFGYYDSAKTDARVKLNFTREIKTQTVEYEDPDNPGNYLPREERYSVFSVAFATGRGDKIEIGAGDYGSDALVKLGYGESRLYAPDEVNPGNFDYTKKLTLSSAFDYDKTLAELGYSEGAQFMINGERFAFDGGMSLQEVLDAVNNADIGARLWFDENASAFRLDYTGAGADGTKSFEDTTGFLRGYMGIDARGVASHVKQASDAVFVVDGAYVSRESNTFEINGVEITLNDAAAGQKITIDVSRDVQPTLDLIYKFVDEYNALLDAINKQVTTGRPKSDNYSYYEPLTDDERAALSEREIELWEEKAKTGMLFRDDILINLQSELRRLMYSPVTLSDGSRLALYDIGITTTNADRSIGKLQIDEEKLRKALNDNPNGVMELFTNASERPGVTPENRRARMLDQGLGDRLNDIIRNTIDMGGTIYNRAGIADTSSVSNNELFRQLRTQDDRISDMMNYLMSRENYYYRIFANMESAMARANNQMAAIMAMMGQS